MKAYSEVSVIWGVCLLLIFSGCAASMPPIDHQNFESTKSVLCGQFDVVTTGLDGQTVLSWKGLELQVRRCDTNRSQWFPLDEDGYVFIPLSPGDYEISRLLYRDPVTNETRKEQVGWRVSVPQKSAYYLGSYRVSQSGQAFTVDRKEQEKESEDVVKRGKKKLGAQLFDSRELITHPVPAVERTIGSRGTYDFFRYHWEPPVNFPTGGGWSGGMGGSSPSLPKPPPHYGK